MAEQVSIIVYGDDREETISYTYVNTPHVASTLLDDVYDESMLAEAMEQARQVCLHMHVPIQQHFQHIFVHGASGHIQDDWALSDFAFYLLLMNGNAHHADVARAQAYAVFKAFCR